MATGLQFLADNEKLVKALLAADELYNHGFLMESEVLDMANEFRDQLGLPGFETLPGEDEEYEDEAFWDEEDFDDE